MNEDIYAEYLVKRKNPPYRIPAIIGTVFAALVCLYLSAAFSWGYLSILVLALGIMFGWRYLKVEYEYQFITSELVIDKIFSQTTRKNAKKIDMSSVESVDPTNEEANKNAAQDKNAVLEDYSSHTGAETYTIVYSDKGKTCRLIFEPNEKVLKAMWRCSPSKVHIKK